MLRTIFVLLVAALLFCASALAESPCTEPRQRALVMGGGGSKGAFQAGAVYHLVLHRGCDFAEISGTSVGALNGAMLAQAGKADDPEASLVRLQKQSENLVRFWESIRATKDVVRGRPMSALRFGLFGLEAMKNFAPLRGLLERHISLERLEGGRELRVGTVSFHDGRYREIVLNAGGVVQPHAIDQLFGSAMLPMYGTMPRIPQADGATAQFADAGLRHTTPVSSYFQVCAASSVESAAGECVAIDGSVAAAHPRIEQLFVVTTSPYERGQQVRPVFDQTVFERNTRHIRDGRKIMARAVDVIMDTMYRYDLDTMFLANDLLRWQHEMRAAEVSATRTLPVRSFNSGEGSPTVTQPYELALISPAQEDAEVTAMLDFSPRRIARQLYCGCVAADRVMHLQFGLASAADKCTDRFRPTGTQRKAAPQYFTADACVDPDLRLDGARALALAKKQAVPADGRAAIGRPVPAAQDTEVRPSGQ